MTASSRAAGPLLVLVCGALAAGEARGQETWRTVTLSRQPSGESALSVDVRYGAGEIRLRSTDQGPLYRMHLRYDEEAFTPLAEYEPGRLRVGVEGLSRSGNLRREITGGELDLELSRGVPLDLRLDLGAVRAELDLGGLSLSGLQLRTGASETRLDVSSSNPTPLPLARLDVGAAEFTARSLGNLGASEIAVSAGVGKVRLELTGDWQRDARVQVQMGLGSLELVVPSGLGVRLDRRTFLTSIDAQGLEKRGDTWYSAAWDDAEHRVIVDVNAAFGSIRVVRAP